MSTGKIQTADGNVYVNNLLIFLKKYYKIFKYIELQIIVSPQICD